MIKPIKIYKSIDSVDIPLSAFKPVFIEKPVFPADVFQKQFETLEPEKKNLIQKFANLEELYKLVYKIWDLKTIASLPVEKVKTLFSMASMKDSSLMLRFSPTELFKVSQLSNEQLNFIKPAARQKNADGIFNFNFAQLSELSHFNKQEMDKAMLLLDCNLAAEDLIEVCKDNMSNAGHLRKRLLTLRKLFSGNIYDIRVLRSKENYVIALTKKKDHRVSSYVFDKKFNPDKNYKSDVDFAGECFKKKGIFQRMNIFSSEKSAQMAVLNPHVKVSAREHIEALDTIQEQIDNLKEIAREAYRSNMMAINSGTGKLKDAELKLPKNLIKDFWDQGALSEEDLVRICTENAGFISESDFKYFALRKIRLTPYDTEKCLEIRRKNVLAEPVSIDSAYYKKVAAEVLATETKKLDLIKAEKKLIIVDGLPGAGKSTIIEKLLKKDKNAYYAPDSDDIKKAFTEVYKNGAGASLVHKASGTILKKEILPEVFKHGKNLIFQTAGSSERIHKILEIAKNNGYTVNLIHIVTPDDISVTRAISRFEQTGRFIDPYDILAILNKNTKEKKYTSRIFSYDERLQNAYVFKDKELYRVEEGNLAESGSKYFKDITG